MADPPRVVVLAAGLGTRMRSKVPKVLHRLAGRPLVLHVVEVATDVGGRPPVVVTSPEHPEVAANLLGWADVVEQPQALGTGDAVRSVPAGLREPGTVVVLNSDVPLLRASTVRALVDRHRTSGNVCTLLATPAADGAGLGRIVRDAGGNVTAIVEERDLVPGEPTPSEGNAGVYVFEGRALWPALDRLTAANAQGEYYLTDVVGLLDGPVEAVAAGDQEETLGVNDRRQLAAAEAVLRRRTIDALMLAGVTVEDPSTTYVDSTVAVGQDSVLRPMTVLRGDTVLGAECIVGPMAHLRDVRAGNRVHIGASYLEDCVIEDGVVVGQFNRVRPGSVLEAGAYLGTHAEVKNSVVGARTRVGHFSCVLDSDVGSDVNIGAGTVTVNYDGTDKHRTAIGDGAFIGTDSSLVAPLSIGAGAFVGAGSVITADVPAGALALERSEQTVVEGWVARRRRRQAAALPAPDAEPAAPGGQV